MNITSTLCWCNIWDHHSLQNVGPDVVAVRNLNTIKFVDCKTGAQSFFKCETAINGLDISAYCGHVRFPFFGFAEVILEPQIYVYKYPEMIRFSTLPKLRVPAYVDLNFTQADMLAALSGYPDFTLCLFNYRKSELIIQYETNVPCSKNSLYVEHHLFPMFAQYSQWDSKLLCYASLTTGTEVQIKLFADIPLGDNFRESKTFIMTFTDDHHISLVDDYGDLYMLEVASATLIKRWSSSSVLPENEEILPQSHMLTYHKGGFLISNQQCAYYLKKKAATYTLEWRIEAFETPLDKIVSNANGELYGVTGSGSIYTLTVEPNNETVTMTKLSGSSALVKDFTFIKGIKDEAVLLFNMNGSLELVEILRATRISLLEIENACSFVAHQTMYYVAVGTTTGHILLVSYEKTSAPTIVFELDCESPAIVRIQFMENVMFFEDLNGHYHVVNAEFKPIKLTHTILIDEEELTRNVAIIWYILIEGPRVLFFVTRDTTAEWLSADELWIISWSMREKVLRRFEITLQQKYAYVCIVPPVGRLPSVEFAALIMNTNIFEIFTINESNEIRKLSMTKTNHFMPLNGIFVSKNLLTWGTDGIVLHFRSHKRSPKPFMIARFLKLFFTPHLLARVEDAFNSKYLVTHYDHGLIRVLRLPPLADNLRENTAMPIDESEVELQLGSYSHTPLNCLAAVVKDITFPTAILLRQEKLHSMIAAFAARVSELIDYDMSVTGKTQGIFKKFCFHYKWLDSLTEQAQKLCAAERASIELAIADQSRIRDWIMSMIKRNTDQINYKVRAIFANANFGNFAEGSKTNQASFDKYRFYDLEYFQQVSIGDEVSLDEFKRATKVTITEELGEEEEFVEQQGFDNAYRFRVEGNSVLEYVMLPQFALQDKNLVTSNQIYNENCKFRYYLNEPMKVEFNRLFHEAQQLKQETINNVLGTNAVLYKIYDNMNIMLRLLNMETFTPPELSVPTLAKDEVVARILEVDDSELKAINRRRRKTIDTGGKRGRLLLWSFEFWARALIVMMDGVVEKLWEEEIKKDIPVPEFTLKKQPHEYSLEEQKLYRIYEEAVHQLAEDRKKYLRILHENESKTLNIKAQQIMRLNRRVTELMWLKLKYDYAIKQNRIRVLNLKKINYERAIGRDRIEQWRKTINSETYFLHVFQHLTDYDEQCLADIKTRLDAAQTRDKAVDRQFRTHYLNTVPHAAHEMTKLYRKRPKISTKIFNSPLLCIETANKLGGKQQQRMPFPLASEAHEMLQFIDELDNVKNCPQTVDQKSWDSFIKLRRQKVESELRIKAVMLHQLEMNNSLVRVQKEAASLKESKTRSQAALSESIQRYVENMRNATLQLTLTLGQVEVSVSGSPMNLSGAVLMHVDDINEVNEMIRDAGNKKLKAMMRVAMFRRQVIFKEWEHKIHKANIEYLKYMLDAVERCKVSMEFLNLLRNWEKAKQDREKFMAEGAIERVIQQKIAAFRKHIERINIKIDTVKSKTLEMKRLNHSINLQIDRTKVDVAFFSVNRDYFMEEKRQREQKERMDLVKIHRNLMDNIRRDYARMLELSTILELLRLRTYPTLAPAPPQCPTPKFMKFD